MEGGRGKCQTRTIVWRADGAGPNGPSKARSARHHALGRPPERREVDIRRAASATEGFLLFVLQADFETGPLVMPWPDLPLRRDRLL
jgi:hypothetical protein